MQWIIQFSLYLNHVMLLSFVRVINLFCLSSLLWNHCEKGTIYISCHFMHGFLNCRGFIFSILNRLWSNVVWHGDVLMLIDCDAPFTRRRGVRCEHVCDVSCVRVCVRRWVRESGARLSCTSTNLWSPDWTCHRSAKEKKKHSTDYQQSKITITARNMRVMQ